jgi:hypothetical protein
MFQMSRRNYTGITIVIVILFFDAVVYKYQAAGCSNKILLRCSPASETVPSGDSNGNSKYDPVHPVIK